MIKIVDGKSEIVIKINPTDIINIENKSLYSQTWSDTAKLIKLKYGEDIKKIIEKYGNCITINNNIMRISVDDDIYDVIFDTSLNYIVKLIKFKNVPLDAFNWGRMDRTDRMYVDYCEFSCREIDNIYDLLNDAIEYMKISYEYL